MYLRFQATASQSGRQTPACPAERSVSSQQTTSQQSRRSLPTSNGSRSNASQYGRPRVRSARRYVRMSQQPARAMSEEAARSLERNPHLGSDYIVIQVANPLDHPALGSGSVFTSYEITLRVSDVVAEKKYR